MMGAAANAAEILTETIESRGIMRRTAARIGLIAALALSVGVAAVNAASARAEEPGLVSATRADTDGMNYAINRTPRTSSGPSPSSPEPVAPPWPRTRRSGPSSRRAPRPRSRPTWPPPCDRPAFPSTRSARPAWLPSSITSALSCPQTRRTRPRTPALRAPELHAR